MLRMYIYYLLLIPQIICAQKEYYIPKPLIIPSHDGKQQLYASIGRGGGYNLDISYTVTNHFAIFTTGVLDRDTKKRTSLWGDRFNIEKNDYVLKAGLGYFKKIKKPRLYNIIESYLGIGLYKVENYWYFIEGDLGGDSTMARYWNIFWQINICRKEKKQELTFALRVSYNRYDSVNFFTTEWNSRYPRNSYQNLNGLSVDPAISYSYRVHNFKFSAQAGLSLPLWWPQAVHVNTNFDQSIQAYKEDARPAALIGKLSIQYEINFGNKKNKTDN